MLSWRFSISTFKKGRPPKPEEFRKTNVLRIRLTESERALLDDAADEQDTSTWARNILKRAANRTKKPSVRKQREKAEKRSGKRRI